VFKFLGNYNLFHGRKTGSSLLPPAALPHEASGETFVRPHDIEICRENADQAGIPALVEHIGFAGAMVNIELLQADDHKSRVEAQLTLPAFKQLDIQRGDSVFIKLRTTHEFNADYSI
jgi:sulfate transport system ATP-binding protein